MVKKTVSEIPKVREIMELRFLRKEEKIAVAQYKFTTDDNFHTNVRLKNRVPFRRHKNGGGFVQDTCKVAHTVYVHKQAVVYGNVIITGRVKLQKNATVGGKSNISGNVKVDGWVENVKLAGNVRITEGSVVNWITLNGNITVSEDIENKKDLKDYLNDPDFRSKRFLKSGVTL